MHSTWFDSKQPFNHPIHYFKSEQFKNKNSWWIEWSKRQKLICHSLGGVYLEGVKRW